MMQSLQPRPFILALGVLCGAAAVGPAHVAEAQPEAEKALQPATRKRLIQTDPAPTFKRKSGPELMRLIRATPTGIANVRMAEKQGVKIDHVLNSAGSDCQFPSCVEATPKRPEQYYEGWKLWAQDVVWEGGLFPSIYLKAGSSDPDPEASALERRPRATLQMQQVVYRPGVVWYVITFDVCRGWQPPSPRYGGRVRARVLQGMTSAPHAIHALPSAEAELEVFDSETFPGSRESCFTMPVLARFRPSEPKLSANTFALEVLQGELTLVRATARPL